MDTRGPKTKGNSVTTNRGRPRTPEQLRRLILKLARENDWGYTRIMGELKMSFRGLKPATFSRVKIGHCG